MTASHERHEEKMEHEHRYLHCPRSQVEWPNTTNISHIQESGWHMVSPKEVAQNNRQNGPIARTRAARLYPNRFAVPEVELGLAEAAVLVAPGGGVSF